MLTALGRLGGRLVESPPWTNVLGLARTLLAAGTCGTLLFNGAEVLFRPALDSPEVPACDGAANIGLFCLMPPGQLELARWIGIAILVVVLSGWRPRWTALPHWWVSFSFFSSAVMTDGGDQVTAILTLLLVPVALTDGRRWHWSAPATDPPPPAAGGEESRRLVAGMALWFIRVQVAVIYFDAFTGKLRVGEWVDGTVLYYWLTDPAVGAVGWLRPFAVGFAATALGAVALAWGTLALEFALMLGLFLPVAARRYLLVAGITFHLGIAVVMGLVSFGLAMFAALLLYLRPMDQPFARPEVLRAAAGAPALRRLWPRARPRGAPGTAIRPER